MNYNEQFTNSPLFDTRTAAIETLLNKKKTLEKGNKKRVTIQNYIKYINHIYIEYLDGYTTAEHFNQEITNIFRKVGIK